MGQSEAGEGHPRERLAHGHLWKTGSYAFSCNEAHSMEKAEIKFSPESVHHLYTLKTTLAN